MKVRVLFSALAAATGHHLVAPEPRQAVSTGATGGVPHGGHPLKGTSRLLDAAERDAAAAKSGATKKDQEEKKSGPAAMKKEKKAGPPEKDAGKIPKEKKKSDKAPKSLKKPKSDGVADAIPPLTTNIFDMSTNSPTMAVG